MKIDRLIGIITMLLKYEKLTAPQLAKKFEVSRRTISRDIETICSAGIPIVTISGYNGGICIADGYKIDKSLLTKDELQSIFTGLKSIDSVSKTSHSKSLIEKLSINPVDSIINEDVVLIDLASHYQGSLTYKIETIKKAILKQNLIYFDYYYKNGESKRTVEPYLLLFKWSSWYLYAFCLNRQNYRLFKLNRLWNIEAIDTIFKLRQINYEQINFDKFLTENKIHFKAVFNSTVKYRIVEEYGVDSFKENQNKDLIFEWDFANYEAMKNWVMSFGSSVQVLEPLELRHNIYIESQKVLEIYK